MEIEFFKFSNFKRTILVKVVNLSFSPSLLHVQEMEERTDL